MKKLPSLKQLYFFVSLDKYLHFSRAAKACFVAQPTFSVAIKDLEIILNATLAKRTHKEVTITETGKRVAARARKILLDVEELFEIVVDRRKPLSGDLRLGVIPTIAPFILPKLLPKILHRYPELNLYIKEGLTRDIYDSLIDGDLDLLLIALPFDLENVETLSLFRDYFFFARHKNTHLMHTPYTSEKDLPEKGVLLLDDGHCLREHTLQACNMNDTSKVNPYSTSSLHTIIQMVNNDLGVTFIPQLAINSDLLKKTQIYLSRSYDNAYREIGFVWRKGAAREREFHLFARLFIEADPNRKSPQNYRGHHNRRRHD